MARGGIRLPPHTLDKETAMTPQTEQELIKLLNLVRSDLKEIKSALGAMSDTLRAVANSLPH
jgi:hypothetical protein